MSKITNLLNDFWRWAGMAPETYAAGQRPVEEYMYPQWKELIRAANTAVDQQITGHQTLDDILTVMALDNENEDVLDHLSTCGVSEEYIQKLTCAGARHMQHHARWQVAVLLARRKTPNSQEILDILSRDNNAYVRQRARNAMKDLKLDTGS